MKLISFNTDKEREYITKFQCKTSNFYGLPKIHKSKAIEEKVKEAQDFYLHRPNPKDFKLRPIVAGPTCETHRISNFLDILLKPNLKYVKSYVKDDIDILRYIPRQVSKDAILASFDIVNLCSNIPHEYGLEATSYCIEKYPEALPERINKEFIIKGLKFILENNYFRFDNQI